MSAIEFVVRSDAGALNRGFIGGEGVSAPLMAEVGSDISLKLERTQILSYGRRGQALEITLIDGQVIVVENYFSLDGLPQSDLFISTDGLLSEVQLAAGPGDTYFSTYVDSDAIGKWGPDDELYFLDGPAVQLAGVVADDVGMLDTGFLTGLPLMPAALLGAAALAPTVAGGSEGTEEEEVLGTVETRPDPVAEILTGTVESGTVVNAEDHADGVDIVGTGTPGATVVVTVGEATQETVIGDDGNWGVTFPSDEIDTGTYEIPVEVVVSDDGREITLEETLSVDTEASVTFDEDAVGGDGTVNDAEAGAEVLLTGTTEPGSTVVVSIDGVDYEAVVDGESWTVTLGADTLADGEYVQNVTVTATDAVGNTAVTTGDFTIDTETSVGVATATIGGNGVVNAQEHASGFTVTGTAEAGASVVVTLGDASHTVTATSEGTWSVYFVPSEVPDGTYEATVTAVATDIAGNTATASGTIQIDTEMSVTVDTASVEIDGIVNAAEASDGVSITGTAEAGSAVTVIMGSVTHTTTAAADGTWSVTYAANEIATGTYNATVQVSATDAAGNTATTTGTLTIDTEARVTFDESAVGGDGMVDASEAGNVVLTGTTEAGSTVTVTLNGAEYSATVTGTNWTLTLPAGDVPSGEYLQDVTVTAIDRFGNTASTTGSYAVDTETSVTVDTSTVEGDGIVNAVEHSDGVTLTGTAEAGATVQVTMAGVTQTVTANGRGEWSADFAAADVPTGETTVDVSVTSTDLVGNTASASGTIEIDTITDVTIDTSTFGGDSVVNAVERDAGITLTGTAEAGASVAVTMAGVTQTVTAGANGAWNADFAAADIPTGETTADVTVTSTDAAGNTATATDTVQIDTFVNALDVNSGPVGGDGVINFEEQGQAIELTGVVEPGSTVEVSLAGVAATATVAADGSWSVSYPANAIPGGEYDTDLVVSATDAAGNTADLTQAVRVDTVAGDLTLSPDPIEGDDIVNAVEHSDGVTIYGTATPGLTVTVTLGEASQQVVAAADGTWSTDFASATIPVGTYDSPISATITDDAGNTKSVTDVVRIDTELPFTLDAPIEGDDVINAAEAEDGVVLSGTVEPGSTVEVTFAGSSRTVTAGADGVWSVSYAAADIPAGESLQDITAVATDIAGNEAVITDQVRVDTIVNTLTVDGPVEGDDLVNRAEAGDGITLTGTVEVGSTVMVTFEGITRAATVASDGSWNVDFAANEIPGGEYTADVTIDATDAYGNTRSITDSFEVDTTPPEAPLIESYTRSGQGVRALSTSLSDDNITIHSVDSSGQAAELDPVVEENTTFNELDFNFTQPVPNGSHLVMNASDDSGNSTATLFVLEETNTNAVSIVNQGSASNSGLDGFDIEAIDLQFAEDSVLTLTASDLEALCAHSNSLTIHGGQDDTVNIAGATATGETSEIGGQTYAHYALGDNGGSLIIDETINVIT
ncbi:Ig-like domain-containing protein [Flavimaricola marinus]|uniref:HYR domain protein n=1 Tax=Flavimaricola marinus TaxID=1819565 RepID=A0A238LIW2_9RHOB|nr:Ig-like domain-containing protein [Flavimaricola marinus]SMY09552.1 hypothetical protein LOM8899_03719 [Flavimaricola marinus]